MNVAIKHIYHVNDDYPTPRYLVECIKPFLDEYFKNRNRRVWCPFDTADSEYVRFLKDEGYDVVYGDIKTGQDFFETPTPEGIELVISNPPFSRKKAIFERLFNEGVPFVLLMNLQAIQYQEIGLLFWQNQEKYGEGIQMIVPDKKVSFDGGTSGFCSGYVTWKFTDRTHWVHLEHNNSKKYFIPAYSLTVEENSEA